MTLRRNDKEGIIADVRALSERSQCIVAAHQYGMTADQISQLRQAARESQVHVQVVRNTLAKLAFSGTPFECMNEALTGPMILLFAMEEPGSAARVLVSFLKQHEVLEPKALTFGDTLLAGAQLKAVAQLPTRIEAIAMLAGAMNAPVTKLARTCNEVIVGLARALNAVSEQQA